MLVPDTHLRPSSNLAESLSLLPAGQRSAVSAQLASRASDSALLGLTGITVRIDSIQVLDVHASFLSSSADIYPVVGVVTSDTKEPFQARTLNVFNGIRNGDYLSMTPQWDAYRDLADVPKFLDLHVLLMKSNQGPRNIGAELQEAMGSNTVKTALGALATAVGAANPLAGVISTLGASAFQLVTSLLSNEKDEQIFYGVASFEDDPDDLGIGRPWTLRDEKPNACVKFEILGRRAA